MPVLAGRVCRVGVKIYCANSNEWHDLSPTAMAIIIEAFQEGDLQRVNTIPGVTGRMATITVTPSCLLEALSDERLEKFRTRYPGNIVRAEA